MVMMLGDIQEYCIFFVFSSDSHGVVKKPYQCFSVVYTYVKSIHSITFFFFINKRHFCAIRPRETVHGGKNCKH